MTRYLCFPGGKHKALTFSYDDGVEQDIRLADIFRKYNMKATFNINSGTFGPDDGSNPTNRKHRKLSRKEALEIYTDDLFEVACHGVRHESLTMCDVTSACIDVIDDRRNLETLFKRQIHGMAYANGLFNDDVVNILKYAGIWYSRTTESTLKFTMPSDWLRMPATCHHKNSQLMELADKFLELKSIKPSVFYVWGHSYEFEDDNNWYVIEDFCNKMTGKDDIELKPVLLNGTYAIMKSYTKPYASCRYTHPSVEAAIMMREGLNIGDIEEVDIRTYDLAVSGHDHTDIPGSYSAKMSIPYATAAGFIYGKAGLQEFREDVVKGAEITELTKKINVCADDELSKAFPAIQGAVVTVKTSDGKEYTERVDFPKGEPENPMTDREFRERYDGLMGYAGIDMEVSSEVFRKVNEGNFKAGELVLGL